MAGVTPKEYAMAHRASRVRDELSRSATVTEAIYDAGFNSNSRFYEKSDRMLGMTPREFRAGGANTDIRFAVGECSLGAILVAASQKGICAILMGNDPDALVRNLQDRFPRAALIGGDAEFENLVAQVVGFVEAPAIGLDLPLDLRGTAFQQRVWQAFREIPVGTNGELCRNRPADRLAQGGARVAQACGPIRGGRDSLPPGGSQRWRAIRLPLGCRTQTRAPRPGERRLRHQRSMPGGRQGDPASCRGFARMPTDLRYSSSAGLLSTAGSRRRNSSST